MGCCGHQHPPVNGKYYTREDFQDWSSSFSEVLTPYGEQVIRIDKELSGIKVKNVTFVLTEECQLRCTYCYIKHKSPKKMTKETAKQAVDFLFDEEMLNGYVKEDSSPAIILEFIGGEPLLAIDLIDYIVDYFLFKAFELGHSWAKYYRISMSSNGLLYNSEKFQKFLKKHPDKVSIGISVDGNKELHDSCRIFPDGSPSYDSVMKGVREWLKEQCMPTTKLTLAPQNVSYLFDAVANLKSVGYAGIYANPIFEEGWVTDDAKVYYKELKKIADWFLDNNYYSSFYLSLFDEELGDIDIVRDTNYCGGSGKMLAIDTDGKCYPCVRFVPYSLSTPGRKAQPIGDIYKGMDSPEDNEFLKHLQSVTMETQSPQKCLNCLISRGCATCVGFQYDKFGDPNVRATFICEMHQARVLANHYYWNKLYEKLGMLERKKLNVPKKWALNIIDEGEYSYLLSLR